MGDGTTGENLHKKQIELGKNQIADETELKLLRANRLLGRWLSEKWQDLYRVGRRDYRYRPYRWTTTKHCLITAKLRERYAQARTLDDYFLSRNTGDAYIFRLFVRSCFGNALFIYTTYARARIMYIELQLAEI